MNDFSREGWLPEIPFVHLPYKELRKNKGYEKFDYCTTKQGFKSNVFLQ